MSDKPNTGLIVPEVAGGSLQKYDESVMGSVATSGGFLPRLQLMTANSDACKINGFPINHYALVEGKNVIDLGKEVDIYPICSRPKALDMNDPVIACYDPKLEGGKFTGEFKRIADKSVEQNSRCMYGPEFLTWLSGLKRYATFFMGSASARNESPNLTNKMQKREAVTLSAQVLKNAKHTWCSPLIKNCSTPLNPIEDKAEFMDTVEKFNNPPAQEIEKDETKTEDRG